MAKSRRRYHCRIIPEMIEKLGRLARHRTDTQDIDIQEVKGAIQSEIFIAKIAASNNGNAIIGNHEFIVHAVVKPFERPGSFHFSL
jgi:6,7-dimethyl-8-ribityllumazine synthase